MKTAKALPLSARVTMSRRRFLGGATSLVFSLSLAPVPGVSRKTMAADENETAAAEPGTKPGSCHDWLSVNSDGAVTIFSAPCEMGQGSMTALPLIIAEEMDVNWDDVRIEFSPSDDNIYGNPRMQSMLTVASMSVSGYYDMHRKIGAQARKVLLQAAASGWGVPPAELTTATGVVFHKQSGRQASYAELAAAVDVSEPVPEVTTRDLKNPADFHLVGNSVLRHDIPGKTDGSAQFSIDVRLPGMVFAAVEQAPAYKARPLRVDRAEALKAPGVLSVVELEHGVAVIAGAYEAALAAKKKLRIEWSESSAVASFDSDNMLEVFQRDARASDKPTFAWKKVGDAVAAVKAASHRMVREYQTDYVYHAQLEPINSVARVQDNGQAVEVWAGTQAPDFAARAVAEALNIDRQNVTLHRTLLGGGFGRRAVRKQEYVTEAAVLSKKLGRPVKVIWSREDDIGAGLFKPMTAQVLAAGLDDTGMITAWHHRIASEEGSQMSDPDGFIARKGLPVIAMHGVSRDDYAFPSKLVEHIREEALIRVAPVRGVGTVPAHFASESFIDEIAAAHGIDPVEYRLRLLRDSPEGQAVVNAVAATADWRGGAGAGRAKGFAFSDYYGTRAAAVAEVSVNASTGVIRVHNMWIAFDPGLVVQPDNCIAQTEGGAVFGISFALRERVGISGGRAQPSNFHEYHLLRMSETPEIHVELTPSGGHPGPGGEMGTVIAPAAIANAFASLTGKRLRRLPMIPERVLAALNSAPETVGA